MFSDGENWPNEADKTGQPMLFESVPMGTTVNTWQENPAGMGPTGATGPQGATGATGPAGDGFGTLTPASNSRTIGGTAFQPSSTRPTFVSYSARVVSTISLVAGQAGRVELRSDSSNPPATVRARVAGGISGTLSVGLVVSDTAEGPLSYIVPAGHYVQLVSVNEVGTPTFTLPAQVEIVL